MSTENKHPGNSSDSSVIESAARQLLDQLPPSNASTATKDGYTRELHRLITTYKAGSPDQLWAAICATRSKRTYYRRVAATKHFLRNMVELALVQGKTAILEFAIRLHEKLLTHSGNCPVTDPKPRHSKRQDLRGLPEDWRESMLIALQGGKFKLPYLVSAVCGCRPEELRTGITVIVNDASLTLKVRGAKVKATQGQPVREITYSIDSSSSNLVRALHSEIAGKDNAHEASGQITVKIENKAGFTSALRRAGRRLWPRRQSEITPYCLRHAAASDFKEGLSADEVSAALGHSVAETKSLYGQRQMSQRGGLRPESVRAERSIKPARKVKTLHGGRSPMPKTET